MTVSGNEAYFTYQVYNEAIVVPETIDAIRALTAITKDGRESIRITDKSLGMRHDFLINNGEKLQKGGYNDKRPCLRNGDRRKFSFLIAHD